jgi:hypothetical protein
MTCSPVKSRLNFRMSSKSSLTMTSHVMQGRHLLESCASSHLIKSCGKQIEGGEDAAIGAEAILLHDILVVYLQHK